MKNLTGKNSGLPKFIVISSIGQDAVTENAFRLGASYYILKPFDNDALLSRIRMLNGCFLGKFVAGPKDVAENENFRREYDLEG